MSVEMKIKGLMIDPVSNMPIIILKNPDGDSVLPIWVGIFEANAIAMQLENIVSPRPMTHDLLKNVIREFKADVQRVVISDLRENTFFAIIHIRRDGESLAESGAEPAEESSEEAVELTEESLRETVVIMETVEASVDAGSTDGPELLVGGESRAKDGASEDA